MIIRKLFGAAAIATLLAGASYAQTTQPATPAKPAAPAVTAPATTAPATTAAKPAAAPAAQTTKINLNTATEKDLDALPQIGPARAKEIVTARAKTKFKDWNDFVTRKVVPKNAEDAIKDKVTF
ncbi:ComEA family DNA-binding protein [Terrarubrum flagellatum]|uniref:ComEA family DNA-binding protein n=1 Tax=Terrirubrum flagellatum TaxID=2895980 RepID=UPI003144F7F2